MIKYDDLLNIPYKENGRDMSGMDCYGMTIECFRREGKKLKDIVYDSVIVSSDRLDGYVSHINVIDAAGPGNGIGIKCEFQGELHIGYMLDKKMVLHMTYEGARITPLIALKNPRFFEVVNE